MTAVELAEKLERLPIGTEANQARRVKVAFFLNLLRLQDEELVFTEADILNARDGLELPWARKFISTVLDIPFHEDEQPDLRTQGRRTVIPLQLMAEDDKDITKRLVAFLRPDGRMMVEVQKVEVGTEPRVTVFQVWIEDGRGGSWAETFVTEDLLRAFLRGIRATYAMSDLQKLLPDFGDDAPMKFTEQSAVEHLP